MSGEPSTRNTPCMMNLKNFTSSLGSKLELSGCSKEGCWNGIDCHQIASLLHDYSMVKKAVQGVANLATLSTLLN